MIKITRRWSRLFTYETATQSQLRTYLVPLASELGQQLVEQHHLPGGVDEALLQPQLLQDTLVEPFGGLVGVLRGEARPTTTSDRDIDRDRERKVCMCAQCGSKHQRSSCEFLRRLQQ